jgi:hypothetical protein
LIFSFYLWDLPPQELILGPPWLERKRGIVNPLSKSLLGQPLVPRNDRGRELVVGLKHFLTDNPVIPSFWRKHGDKVIRL